MRTKKSKLGVELLEVSRGDGLLLAGRMLLADTKPLMTAMQVKKCG